MGFVEIIWSIKTKHVSFPKISMLVQIVGEILPQLCSNNSIQTLLSKGTKTIEKGFVWGRLSIAVSSLIGGKMLNFAMEEFSILIFVNITTKLVISQIKFLWCHHFGTLLREKKITLHCAPNISPLIYHYTNLTNWAMKPCTAVEMKEFNSSGWITATLVGTTLNGHQFRWRFTDTVHFSFF